MTDIQELREAIKSYKSDVIFYNGPIERHGYDQFCDALEEKKHKKESLCIVLVTRGGDPDAAYRIARAAQHHYPKSVEILIPCICKSAGTLLCIGANRLIFGDRGELGPLDIQLSKPDEMFESMSGLDIIQALSALESQVLRSFKKYLIDIRGGSRIRTKMAAEIATRLADGYISPIAAKIDPVTLGEHQRAMQIAQEYGQRLNESSSSLKSVSSLGRLISSYPAHSFVIDRKEAGELFKNVDKPSGKEIVIYNWARMLINRNISPPDQLFIIDLTNQFDIEAENNETDREQDEQRNPGNTGAANSGTEVSNDSGSNDRTAEPASERDESAPHEPDTNTGRKATKRKPVKGTRKK